MPAVLTRCDSLREYLTGAAGDAGAQTNPQASLGRFASSTEALSYGIAIASPIANITVDYASGGNAPGAGSLVCIDANTLSWQDLGGTVGASQSISNGQQIILESGESAGAYIRVSRTSATALVPGTATVTLSVLVDNVFGVADVLSSEAVSGGNEYVGTIVKNVSANPVTAFLRWIGQLGTAQVSGATQLPLAGAGTITLSSGNFNDWPASGWCQIQTAAGALREIVYYNSRTSTVLTVLASGRARLGSTAAAGVNTDNIYAVPGIRLGIDSAGVQAAASSIQTIANINTSPAGVSWLIGILSSTGLNIGTLAAGQLVGIWIHREIPAGSAPNPSISVLIQDSFNAT